MRRISLTTIAFAATIAAAAIMPAQATAETIIRVGTARAISVGATLYAIERGYFKDAGIKLEMEYINSSADVMAMVAQNQYQIVEGGVSAGFFNAVEKNLPLRLVADRTSSPFYHNIMLRPELKDSIKTVKDLKGKVIASNGPGSISTYEIGKVLETAGLSLADVEIKVIPFTQMAIALKNGAVDAALLIPPFTYQTRDQGLGVMFIDPDDYQKPQPVALAVNILNTDWASKNQQAAKDYFVAYIKGVRAYCQAVHGGSSRKEMIDLLVKAKIEPRQEALEAFAWQSRNPDGRINVASIMDVQDFYIKGKFTNARLPADKVIDTTYVDYAVQKLGPFQVENKDSKVKGCR
jgi:NitT/TauT family transport system substrate-binding protein